jgi:hypothetical protein
MDFPEGRFIPLSIFFSASIKSVEEVGFHFGQLKDHLDPLCCVVESTDPSISFIKEIQFAFQFHP